VVCEKEVVMENIPQVIREKVARLREVEAEATRLRVELAEIRDAAGEAVPAPPLKNLKRTKGSRAADRKKRPIRPGSNMFAAIEVLSAAGRPMHVDTLLPAAEKIVGKKISKATFVGQISEYIRAERYFSRPEASTFGLKAWDKNRVVAIKREPVAAEAAL
jgi:hypothetical protein